MRDPMVRDALVVLNNPAFATAMRWDRPAFVERFLRECRPLLASCVSHFVADRSTQDDLYQDVVFFVLERMKDEFEQNKLPLGIWLYRTAWARCVEVLARREAQKKLPPE